VGIFPRLSAVIGLHHYTYYVNGMPRFQALPLLVEVQRYAREVNIRGARAASTVVLSGPGATNTTMMMKLR